MQENNSPDHAPDILSAEIAIYESDAKILSLLREFKGQGYPLIQYPYVDRQDQVSLVTISGSEIHTRTPSYIVTAGTEHYKLDVTKRWNEEQQPHQTEIKFKRYDRTQDDYVTADEPDVIKLAEILEQLDPSAIRQEMYQVIRDKKAPKARMIGKLLGRFFGQRPGE